MKSSCRQILHDRQLQCTILVLFFYGVILWLGGQYVPIIVERFIGLLVIAFLPGRRIIRAIFEEHHMAWVEKYALSVVLSLSIVPFVVFLLHHYASITISHILVYVIVCWIVVLSSISMIFSNKHTNWIVDWSSEWSLMILSSSMHDWSEVIVKSTTCGLLVAIGLLLILWDVYALSIAPWIVLLLIVLCSVGPIPYKNIEIERSKLSWWVWTIWTYTHYFGMINKHYFLPILLWVTVLLYVSGQAGVTVLSSYASYVLYTSPLVFFLLCSLVFHLIWWRNSRAYEVENISSLAWRHVLLWVGVSGYLGVLIRMTLPFDGIASYVVSNLLVLLIAHVLYLSYSSHGETSL